MRPSCPLIPRKCHSLATALISNLMVERSGGRLPRENAAPLVFLGEGFLGRFSLNTQACLGLELY